MQLPTASTLNCGSYGTPAGPREIVVIGYSESSYALFDQRFAPDGEDYDERCIEAELLTLGEAEAVARDYLDNARAAAKPLVRVA